MGYIYKIINDVNNKLYIGKTTKSLSERWKEHKACVSMFKNKKYKHDTKLYRAMLKYGIDKFHIELLETTDDVNTREKYWIKYYNTIQCGYNISPGGEGGPLFKGHHHSNKVKQEASKRNKGLHWYTDGNIDVMRDICPQGFRPGRSNINMNGQFNHRYGKPAHNKGIKMAKSAVIKLRASLKKLNSTRKMVWYTNGFDEIQINSLNSHAIIPEGYHKGRLKTNIINRKGVLVTNLITGERVIYDSMDSAARNAGLSFITVKRSCDLNIPVKYNTFTCEYVYEENKGE